jgi:predicted anti-sigma-YlaC factor YlaD
MTGSADCRDIRQALGVYVLGAIDPAERALVDAHLSTCPECREELAGLAGLPALLRRVPVTEAEWLAHDESDDAHTDQAPSEEMLRSLLARTARHRRERMWRGLAAAAAIVLVAGSAGAAGWDVLHPAAGGTAPPAAVGAPHWHTVSGADRATLTSVKVRFAPQSWGTALNVQVRGVPVGTDCQFQVTDSSGHRFIVGGWTATYGDSSVWYPGATSIPVNNMRSFQITSGTKVLVSVPAQ